MKQNRIKPEDSLKIIIVGCGKIGQNLAEQLAGQGNDITVIDVSREKVKDICASCDCMGVVGNGATHALQHHSLPTYRSTADGREQVLPLKW